MLGQPRQLDAYSAMAREAGYPELAGPQPDYGQPMPDVSGIRAGWACDRA